jgi:hypothetical protein
MHFAVRTASQLKDAIGSLHTWHPTPTPTKTQLGGNRLASDSKNTHFGWHQVPESLKKLHHFNRAHSLACGPTLNAAKRTDGRTDGTHRQTDRQTERQTGK